MKTLKILALLSALTALPVLGDVEALYWQVTSEMNPKPISFSAAAFAAVDGNGKVINFRRDEANLVTCPYTYSNRQSFLTRVFPR